jgi:hypothetical protein
VHRHSFSVLLSVCRADVCFVDGGLLTCVLLTYVFPWGGLCCSVTIYVDQHIYLTMALCDRTGGLLTCVLLTHVSLRGEGYAAV